MTTGAPSVGHEQVGEDFTCLSVKVGVLDPKIDYGTCLFRFAKDLGVSLPKDTVLLADFVQGIKSSPKAEDEAVLGAKALVSLYAYEDERNHIDFPESQDLVDSDLNISTRVPILGDFVTTVRDITNTSWMHSYKLYATTADDDRFEELGDAPLEGAEYNAAEAFEQPSRSTQLGHAQSGSTSNRQGGLNTRATPRGNVNLASAGGDRNAAGSPNLGLNRRTGAKRVVGGGAGVRKFDLGAAVVRSYTLSPTVQFNDFSEMRLDAVSREHAQEIIEELFFTRWKLDLSDSNVAKKAEDMLHAFMIVRTASPYADYTLPAVIGKVEVDFSDLSDVLKGREVTRRQFARAIADDIRKYIRDPDNAALRDKLQTLLGVQPQYVTLAFDGSTDCSGLSRHEIAFTKSLESNGLFDDESVQGKLSNASLLDSNFTTAATPQRKRAPI